MTKGTENNNFHLLFSLQRRTLESQYQDKAFIVDARQDRRTKNESNSHGSRERERENKEKRLKMTKIDSGNF